MNMNMQAGLAAPFGAHPRDGGVNFAVMSEHATRIELCVFDESGTKEVARHTLIGPTHGVFHGFLPGAAVGLLYGFRAYGPYAPHEGHRFNPHKLLLDPYAREIVGQHQWGGEHRGYAGEDAQCSEMNTADNAAFALKARVAAPLAALQSSRPHIQTHDMLLYEVHVKGFSQSHPDIPNELRGTYAALSHPLAIAHFKRIGVTALSLLPVQYHLDEHNIYPQWNINYWGYNTLGFFCVDPRFTRNAQDVDAARIEFREMVQALHAADIEVILDVVYNHTPEGNEFGTTLSFRGLDNATWYRAQPGKPQHAENYTGCGNTLNVAHPRVTQFVLDSLRYWVEIMGVDGFRFDLASVLGRTQHGFDTHAAFFAALQQDPVLAHAKLIAEPWDIGPQGYQVGNFPGRFQEWNDKFRDSMRRYWLNQGVDRGEFVQRFMASGDTFGKGMRKPNASVNYVAVHDGYTLHDVVSYNQKHNEGNGENNRDGRDGEPSCNFGVEGETSDESIVNTRARVKRAMMATLLLAQGTPMICAGDEMGKTQRGNNNAYCQDNELSWLDWAHADDEFCSFVAQLAALRRAEPALHFSDWFMGAHENGAQVLWRLPNGHALNHHDWHAKDQYAVSATMNVAGSQPLLLAFNPHHDMLEFHLPEGAWQWLLNSAHLSLPTSLAHNLLNVPAQSLCVLRLAE